jgi:hypothetical protein
MDDDTMDDVIERADVDLNLRRAQRTQSDVRPRQRRGGQLANQNHSN